MASQIAIIGGGSSGLMAALLLEKKGFEVQVFEASDKLGWTILRAGNGRCNFSSSKLSADEYSHSKEIAPVLGSTPEQDILELFDNLGLKYTLEEDRYYPASMHARSVLEVIMREIHSHESITIHTNTKVERLVRYDKASGVQAIDNDVYPFALFDEEHNILCEAEWVIWAAGGSSIKDFAQQNALAHTKLTPLLCPLKCEAHILKGLSGIRAQALLKLCDTSYKSYAEEFGELLIRSYGVSGIASFNLSRKLKEHSILVIDFAPDMSMIELCAYLDKIIANNPGIDYAHLLDGLLHPDLGRRIMELTQDNAERILFELEPKRKSAKKAVYPPTRIHVSAVDTPVVASLVKNFELKVLGTTQLESAQVVRGGLELREINLESFELKRIPKLYVLGEALDVDGACGGYNLAWAWLSALRCAEQFK